VIRNLIFYCYPIRETIWPWHVDRLLERRNTWNGRRIVVLALDDRTDKEDVVRAKFAPLEAEILIRKNDSGLAETAHFIDTLALLESKSDDEATFYAHAKGVTRNGPMFVPVQRWSELMYRACLDFPALVERRLGKFGTVGCLRWRHVPHPSRKGWCWAGTFFWVRHGALFTRDWRKIDRAIYGVEDYPSRQFKVEEGYCLTDEQVHPISLYTGIIDEKFIARTVASLATEEAECIRV
jgi:hypothetical protein